MHRCIHAVSHVIEDHAEKAGLPARFCATKIIEGDEPIIRLLDLDQNELELIEHTIQEMETESGLDKNAALADMRYCYIDEVVAVSVKKSKDNREWLRSIRADKILTGTYTALPMFAAVMVLLFWLTFNVIGSALSDWLSMGIDALTSLTDAPAGGVRHQSRHSQPRYRRHIRWTGQRARLFADHYHAVLLSFNTRRHGLYGAHRVYHG